MVLYWYRKLRVIGTVIHELAHALTVKLCGGHVDELDITSHVNHHGQYNLGHQMAISYAPLVVNTVLAALLANWAAKLSPTGLPQSVTNLSSGLVPVAITTVGLQLFALCLGFLIATAALPSYQDARNPYTTFRRQLRDVTVLRILIFPLSAVLLGLGMVPLAFAYLRSRSPLLSITSEIAFGTAVLLQATGLLVIVDLTGVLTFFG